MDLDTSCLKEYPESKYWQVNSLFAFDKVSHEHRGVGIGDGPVVMQRTTKK